MGTTWLVFHHGQNPGRTDLVAWLRSHRPSHPLNPGLCCPLAGGVEVDQKAAQLSFFLFFFFLFSMKRQRKDLAKHVALSTQRLWCLQNSL